MWIFGKNKDKNKKPAASEAAAKPAQLTARPQTSKEIKTQALLLQMRGLRAEIGEENLQEIVKKLQLDNLKKKVREDIDNNPQKRDRILDEIRFHLNDPDSPTRH